MIGYLFHEKFNLPYSLFGACQNLICFFIIEGGVTYKNIFIKIKRFKKYN